MFNEFNNGGFQAEDLAWMLFVNNGELGMYSLYKNLSDEDEKKKFE